MAEIKIDSWNEAQLLRLKQFFAHSAKEGDVVIFDRELAENNVSSLEGLDDDDCNSFVYRCANMALEGLESADIERLTTAVSLTTKYLTRPAPRLDKSPPPQEQPEENYWDDEDELDLDLMEPEVKTKPKVDADSNAAAADWAETLKRYHTRSPEMN